MTKRDTAGGEEIQFLDVPDFADSREEASFLAGEVVRDAVRRGYIPIDDAISARRAFETRAKGLIDKWQREEPDMPEGEAHRVLLELGAEAIGSTTFRIENGDIRLFGAEGQMIADENLLPEPPEGFFERSAVQVELAIEAISCVIGAVLFGGRLPERTKKAIGDGIERVSRTDWFKRLLIGLGRHLRDRSLGPKEWLRELGLILKQIFIYFKSTLWEIFEDIFRNLSWFDIGSMILDLLLALTPAGWIKKGGALVVTFTAIGLNLSRKYEAYQAEIAATT